MCGTGNNCTRATEGVSVKFFRIGRVINSACDNLNVDIEVVIMTKKEDYHRHQSEIQRMIKSNERTRQGDT